MHVGVLQIELLIRASESLKDKRRVVKSVKDRLHREHQVSVAEVATQDHHRVATLGVSVTAEEAPRCASIIENIVQKLTDRASRPGAGELTFEVGESFRRVLSLDEIPHTDLDRDSSEIDAEMLRHAIEEDSP